MRLTILITVGNNQEMAQSEKIPTPNSEVGKTKEMSLKIRYMYLYRDNKS